MKLIELIKQNHSLRLIDADTQVVSTFNELVNNDFETDDYKKLVFLYLDTSLTSISTILTFFNSPHAIALLSCRLQNNLKENLETIYKPDIIFDPGRSVVNNFKVGHTKQFQYFIAGSSHVKSIAPEVKLLLSTSGTTGSPKFVKLSEENIVANALSIIQYLPISRQDVVPLTLPVYYSYGLSVLTTNCIAGGTIVCSVKDIINPVFWEEFNQYKFSSLSGVPYFYEMLYRLGFTKRHFPSLRYLTQAGGRLAEQFVDHFRRYALESALPFYIMYGQTEATARMSYLPPEDLFLKSGSIGKAIPGGSFEIESYTSELLFQGPNIFGGYVNDIEDLAAYDKINTLYTGDLARKDEDGYYYIIGRLKRIAKIFGSRINLDETENQLKNRFPDTRLVCCGVEDKAILIVSDNKHIDHKEILTFLQLHLNIHSSAIRFMALNEIPLTENGKTNYNLIQELYAAS